MSVRRACASRTPTYRLHSSCSRGIETESVPRARRWRTSRFGPGSLGFEGPALLGCRTTRRTDNAHRYTLRRSRHWRACKVDEINGLPVLGGGRRGTRELSRRTFFICCPVVHMHAIELPAIRFVPGEVLFQHKSVVSFRVHTRSRTRTYFRT